MYQVVSLPGGDAAAGITEPIQQGEYVRLGSVAFRLVTSATAGNRQVLVALLDGTGTAVFTVAAPAVQAASLTVDYAFGVEVPAYGSAALGAMGGPLLGCWLDQNMSLAVIVNTAKAGDVLSNGRMLVEEYERETDPEA